MVEFTEACARYMASWFCTDTCAPWLPPSALSPVFTATHSRLRAVRLPAKPRNIPNSAISSFDRMQMPYGNKRTRVFSKRENNSVRDWESGFEPGEKEIKRSTGLLVALTVSCSGHHTVSSFLWKKAQLENVEVKKLASIWLSTKMVDESKSVSLPLMLTQLAVRGWKMSCLLLRHKTESPADSEHGRNKWNTYCIYLDI